jgi:hypothetical protein
MGGEKPPSLIAAMTAPALAEAGDLVVV